MKHNVLIDGKTVECRSAKEKFYLLADQWKTFLATHGKIEYGHGAFLGILGMGPEALPFLHREVEWHEIWLYAITCIEGAVAIGPVGRMSRQRDAWKKRYRKLRARVEETKRSPFRPNLRRIYR